MSGSKADLPPAFLRSPCSLHPTIKVWGVPGENLGGRPADTLRGRIWRQLNAGARVWLTGHSKGGAIATTAAARLLLGDAVGDRECPDPATRRPDETLVRGAGTCLSRLSVFTFNAPLAFSVPLAKAYEEQLAAAGAEHVRFEHRSDRVRMLPAGDGLVHVGREELRGEDLDQDKGVMLGSAIAVAGVVTALLSAGKAIVNNH